MIETGAPVRPLLALAQLAPGMVERVAPRFGVDRDLPPHRRLARSAGRLRRRLFGLYMRRRRASRPRLGREIFLGLYMAVSRLPAGWAGGWPAESAGEGRPAGEPAVALPRASAACERRQRPRRGAAHPRFLRHLGVRRLRSERSCSAAGCLAASGGSGRQHRQRDRERGHDQPRPHHERQLVAARQRRCFGVPARRAGGWCGSPRASPPPPAPARRRPARSC